MTNYNIIFADKSHTKGVLRLLKQICALHSEGRPDIFKNNGSKYTESDLEIIFTSADTPVFAAVDSYNNVLGYAMCRIKDNTHNSVLVPHKELYLDDLCVDEDYRGCGIGKALIERLISYGKEIGCYNLDLNVWEFNENARAFYEKCGFAPSRTFMELILQDNLHKNGENP